MADKLNRVVESVKLKEPGWKLSWNKPGKNDTMARWVSGEDDVIITIVDCETDAKAVSAFRYNQRLMANAPLSKEVKNLGDEALLYDNHAHHSSSLHCRKGSLIVIVNSTSTRIAKHFADEVLKQL